MNTSVLIIDDNKTFADAVRIAIDADPELCCIGIASSATEAGEAVRRMDPDHCLVNLDLPDDEGIEATRAVRRLAPGMAVTVLTGRTDAEVVRRAGEAGASHLVPKQSSISDVLDALRSSHNGRMLLLGSTVVDLLSRRDQSGGGAVDCLTAREYEVLQGMAEGAPPKVIAASMGISVHTVRGHVKNIYWKLDAHSQLEAVAIARRRGLLSYAS